MTPLARILLLGLVLGGTVVVDAEVVPWLYDVEVPVVSQGERQGAASVALAELLRRVTGQAQLPPNPEVEAALREPGNYYGRFTFTKRLLAPEPSAEDADAVEQTFFEVSFEPAAVLALLRRAGLPVWSADRPTVLVWLALEQDGARRLVTAADVDDVAAAIKRRARQRGLKVLFPLMDLKDLEISPTAVWGRFWEAIAAASVRYGTDVLVLGRAGQAADGSWTADWEARSASDDARRDMRCEHSAESAVLAALAGVDHVADTLAARMAVDGELDAIAVTVRGASTAGAYASVLAYLRSREYIERVEVKVVTRDLLTLRLHSRSGRDQLQELLSMGSPMTVAPPVAGPLRGPPTLDLMWREDR